MPLFNLHTNKPKIALFGYYNSDNWGDNLMALIFASFLKEQDVSFCVFIKDSKKDYYSEFIKHTANTVEEFMSNKDFVVFGGGGILAPGHYIPRGFCEDLNTIIHIAQKHKVPIYGISIGGIGNPYRKLTPPFRRQFLQSIKSATVRNQQDLAILKKYGKKGRFFHDILWLTPEFFPSKKKNSEKLTIGINCQTTQTGILGRIFWKIFRLSLYIAAKKMPQYEFIFIDSKISRDQTKTISCMRAFKDCPNTRNYRFRDLVEDMEIINRLDIVFSDKLHLGLVCMSYGKPFVSVMGQPKTKLMLKNIGRSSAYYGVWKAFLLAILILSKKYILKTIRSFELPNKKEIIESARGHLNELTNIITNYNQ